MIRKFENLSELLARFNIDADVPAKKGVVQIRLLAYIYGGFDKSSLVRVGIYSGVQSFYNMFNKTIGKLVKPVVMRDRCEDFFALTVPESHKLEKELLRSGVDISALFEEAPNIKRSHDLFVTDISYAATFSGLPNFSFKQVSMCDRISSFDDLQMTPGIGPQYLFPDRTFFFNHGIWFLEVDKQTEKRPVLIGKVRYYCNYLSGLTEDKLSNVTITFACFPFSVQISNNGSVVPSIEADGGRLMNVGKENADLVMSYIKEESATMNFVSCSFRGLRLLCLSGEDMLYPGRFDAVFTKECNSLRDILAPSLSRFGVELATYEAASSMTIQTEYSGLTFPCAIRGELPIVYEMLSYDACASVRLKRLLLCSKFVLEKPALVIVAVRELNDALDFMASLYDTTKNFTGLEKLRWRGGVTRAYGVRFDETAGYAYKCKEGGFLFECNGVLYAVDDVGGRCYPVICGY